MKTLKLSELIALTTVAILLTITIIVMLNTSLYSI